MRKLQLVQLLVLDFYGQIQNRFNGFAGLRLKLRGIRILLQHLTPEANVPLLVRLDLFAIEPRGRMLPGSLAKLDELLVLLQRERFAGELGGPDPLDSRVESHK